MNSKPNSKNRRIWMELLWLLIVAVVPFMSILLGLLLFAMLVVIKSQSAVAYKCRLLLFIWALGFFILVKLVLLLSSFLHWQARPTAAIDVSFPQALFLGIDGPGLSEYVVKERALGLHLSSDPFTGGPFHFRDGIVYSVGPDRVDDNAVVAWDPTNGVMSGGDIIVLRVERSLEK